MLNNGQAGIDCDDCGYLDIVYSKEHEAALFNALKWPDGHSDPLCPECGALVTFESYINDN